MGLSIDAAKNQAFMISEFVERGSLFDLLHVQQICLPDEVIFKIAKQIANALVYLRKQGILHCKLKSSKVLLSTDWKVKITDFTSA